VKNDPIVVAFVGGMLTAGFGIAALFFLRFWKRTGDRLFLTFGGAFVLLAINQALPVLLGIPSEDQGYVYLLRLAGFALIILAILSKNLRRS
jgi:hypothetical protein